MSGTISTGHGAPPDTTDCAVLPGARLAIQDRRWSPSTIIDASTSRATRRMMSAGEASVGDLAQRARHSARCQPGGYLVEVALIGGGRDEVPRRVRRRSDRDPDVATACLSLGLGHRRESRLRRDVTDHHRHGFLLAPADPSSTVCDATPRGWAAGGEPTGSHRPTLRYAKHKDIFGRAIGVDVAGDDLGTHKGSPLSSACRVRQPVSWVDAPSASQSATAVRARRCPCPPGIRTREPSQG